MAFLVLRDTIKQLKVLALFPCVLFLYHSSDGDLLDEGS